MGDGNVQAVPIIVGDILPVDRARPERHASLRHQIFEIVYGNLIRIGRHHLGNGWQTRLEADEHDAAPDFLLERDKAVRRAVEILEALPRWYRFERTVERIA